MEFKVVDEYERYYVAICKLGYQECFMKSEYVPIDGIIRKKKSLYDPNKVVENDLALAKAVIKKKKQEAKDAKDKR